MNYNKVIQYLIVVIIAMIITSCYYNIESRLNNYEKFIKRWEERKEKGQLSSNECIEMTRGLKALKRRYSEIENKEITPEQFTRTKDLEARAAILLFDCM